MLVNERGDLLHCVPAWRGHDEAGPMEQRTPDLKGREIEGRGGKLQEHAAAAELTVIVIADQPDDAAVPNLNTFRPPG